MESDWLLRGDFDREIVKAIYEGNEYGIPDDMAGKVVLDIGAHIGSLSRLCLERGASVFSVEPMMQSFRLLAGNVAHVQERSHILRAAVADRDGTANLAHNFNPTGNCIFWNAPGEKVPVVAFDRLLEGATQFGGTGGVDFIKIDAEGVEYLIVPASEFSGVQGLAIEFHDEKFFSDARQRCRDCIARLESLGFKTMLDRETKDQYGWYVLYKGAREA